MSKSRGNVINPDDVVERIRRRQPAALRDVHGPAGGDQAVEHARRRGRVPLPEPRLAADRRRPGRDDDAGRDACRTSSRQRETLRQLHQTIQKVTEDLDGMRFNTAIAAMMEFTNHLTPAGGAAALGAGAVRAAAGPVRPAPRRGTVASARATTRRWPTSRGRRTTRRC